MPSKFFEIKILGVVVQKHAERSILEHIVS